jgi:hypothetical protein
MSGISHVPLKERFLSHVSPEPMSGCWLWEASTGPKGYGQFMVVEEEGNRVYRAHRMAWLLFRGSIPGRLYVLHKCDTPPCVNPDHLFLGTQLVNLTDAKQKGRRLGRKPNAWPLQS